MEVIKPTLDKIIVELNPKEKMVGAIELPDNIGRYSVGGKTERGVVKAVGPGKINSKGVLIQPEVQPGDKVVIKKTMGTQMHGSGKEFVICTEAEILAVEE